MTNIPCGILYKITNTKNGKCYIGQTKKSFNQRYPYSGEGIERVYKQHKRYKEINENCFNEDLFNDIENYGFDAFEVIEEFYVAYSEEELNEKEIYYISLYESYKKEKGYNKTLGGKTGKKTIEWRRSRCKKNPISVLTKEGEFIKSFLYSWEVEEFLNRKPDFIYEAIRYPHRNFYGYKWRRATEEELIALGVDNSLEIA